MAKILKCPRCQQSMDVTSVSAGSTVRCPDCGQMARVPTGGTSVAVKTVSAPIPAPQAAPAARERGTRVRERNRASGTMPVPPPQKSSSSGLFIGLGIGAVAVVAVIVVFTMKGREELPAPPKATGPKEPVTFTPKLPPSSDKPIVLGSGDNKGDAKPTVIARSAENVDTANWDALMRDLRPGGGFEHDDRPEGVAFKKVKNFGKAAYPKLIGYIDAEEPAVAVAAVAVLNALTGRDSPFPKGVNKAKIKAEWEEWLKSADASKPDAPK
jgi:ribosomal protein S27E